MVTLTAEKIATLDACFGTYPHTRALKDGAITSDRVSLRFNEVEPINKAFLMMVRQEKFDVSEMAIATYLQAKAYGKPLTLLPATLMGRFQHGTMFYNSERGTLLLDGELDAAIFGGNIPKDARLKSVIADPEAAAKEWYNKHKTVPVNHMVVVKSALAKSDPGAVREIFRMLQASKKAAGLPKANAIDTIPFGFAAVRPALELMSSYALEMKIVPRRMSVEELFDDNTRAL
jgi:hypothetical protein